ncbi:hypothetical protein C8R48DRAFT_669895 [Suillus tomentosus]|nr:hypothetical protein C8R48DRAFT_669895 [Suillus tomentosus]
MISWPVSYGILWRSGGPYNTEFVTEGAPLLVTCTEASLEPRKTYTLTTSHPLHPLQPSFASVLMVMVLTLLVQNEMMDDHLALTKIYFISMRPLGQTTSTRPAFHIPLTITSLTKLEKQDSLYRFCTIGAGRHTCPKACFIIDFTADMTQKITDNPSAVDQWSSPHPSYMASSPASFDYIEEQFGGGRRYEPPPVELTPSRLRTKIKATARDVGVVKGASARRQAYHQPSAEAQVPVSAQSNAFNQDGASTSETSSLTLNVANSRHTSPLPPPQVPAPLQDIFYDSMVRQPPWMQQDAPDFGMMGADVFPAGLLGDPALSMVGVGDKSLWGAPSAPNAQAHLAPLPSQTTFNFPCSSGQSMMSRGCSLDPTGQPSSSLTQECSGQSSAPTLRPISSLPPQDHVPPPLPATNIIPPTPLKEDGGNPNPVPGSATNAPPTSTREQSSMLDSEYYNTAATSHNRFPEENEPVAHEGEHVVIGRRSDDMNAELESGFGDIERCFLKLSTSTTLPKNQLINLFLKSRGRTVNGTNYWNLYANYFKDYVQQELTRISKEVPEGGGTPSATVRRQCYEKFKMAFPDTYQDILSRHEEASLLGSSPQTIAQRAQAFQKHYRSVSSLLESGSARFGFEAAIVLCGKVVNEDGSLGHCYNTPGAAGFWETRCRASDDAMIGHLKAHVYNGTSLSLVNEAFPDIDDSRDNPTSNLNNDVEQFSDVVEGRRDDSLKWLKNEIDRQIVNLGGKKSRKIFPWKLMPAMLVEANLCIKGYPAHKCLLPGEAHSKPGVNKGIGALMQKEVGALAESLKAGTMWLVQFPSKDRAAIIASQKPVIEGEAPPPNWPHPGARRMFINGNTDHFGLSPIKFSAATTKVKRGPIKAPKVPPPLTESDSDDDSAAETSVLKPLPRAMARKLNSNTHREVVSPPARTSRVVARPVATPSDVIELTSTEENLLEEHSTEYEEAGRGKKRKIKSADTSRVSKKTAAPTEKTNTSKAGKKGLQGKNVESKPKVPSMTPPTKGGPLSPLMVGSSSDGLPSPEHGQAMRLRDGPSEEPKKERVKPRPVTKGFQVAMNRSLRTVYGNLDSESEVNNSKKTDPTTGTGTIAEGSGTIANVQPNTSKENSTQMSEREALPQTTPLDAVAPTIPHQQPVSDVPRTHQTSHGNDIPHDDPLHPHEPLHDDNTRDTIGNDPPNHPLHDSRGGREPLVHDHPPNHSLRDPRGGHEPPHEPLDRPPSHPYRDPRGGHELPRDPLHYDNTRGMARNHRDTAHRDPRDHRDPAQHDPHYRGNPREALRPHDPHYTRGYSHEAARIVDRDTLHPHDAFYPRDFRPRYGPQGRYGTAGTRAESEMGAHRDSSPVPEFHGYGPGERERTYASRYSPVEGGYPRRDDLEEREDSLSPYHSRPVGGGNYREGPNRMFPWVDDDPHFDYDRDAVARAYNHDFTNPPRPPAS